MSLTPQDLKMITDAYKNASDMNAKLVERQEVLIEEMRNLNTSFSKISEDMKDHVLSLERLTDKLTRHDEECTKNFTDVKSDVKTVDEKVEGANTDSEKQHWKTRMAVIVLATSGVSIVIALITFITKAWTTFDDIAKIVKHLGIGG